MTPDVSLADRIPPSNLEAEMALLGSVLVDKEMMAAVSEIVRPTDFYASLHETIYLALFALYESGKPLDKVALAEELRSRGMLERIGGLAYLSTLMETVPTAASAEYYAKIVREKASLRGLIHAGTRITQLGYESEDDVPAALDEASQIVCSVRRSHSGSTIGFVDWTAVRIERITWLLVNRIPFGELTIVEGDGGLGKTTVALDIAARLSRGALMPDGTPSIPCNVLLVSEEDRAALVKARLVAARADLARIHLLAGMDQTGRPLLLPSDVPALVRAIEDRQARLVYVDALLSHLDPELNAHRAQDVRAALMPLAEAAHLTGAAIVAVRHLRKGAGAAAERGLGSADIRNIARSVLTVGSHPTDDGRRVIAVSKSNHGRQCNALTYTIVAQVVPADDNNEPVEIGAIAWGDEAEISADELTMAAPATAEERTQRDLAADWLCDALAEGAVRAAELFERAKGERGIAPATLKRAADRLSVVKERAGFQGGSTWRLPFGSHSAQTAHASAGEPNGLIGDPNEFDEVISS